MYRRELQNLLNSSGKFPNFFLLYGSDNFQTELYANFIEKKFAAEESLRLYFEEYDFSRASDFLALGSLFSQKKLLELKCHKKPSAKDLKALISLCKINADNFFLLELYDEGSRQGELEKIFENHFARFFKVGGLKEGVELLAMRARELKIDATQNALASLFLGFDENLYLAGAELNKFEGLAINENTIKQYCPALSFANFDGFLDKLLSHESIGIELEKILEEFNEIALINALSSAFYRFFQIAMYAKINGKIDLKDLLGYAPPPAAAEKLKNQALKFKLVQYHKIFKLLLQTEYELKTNPKLAKKDFLIAAMLEFSRILKA